MPEQRDHRRVVGAELGARIDDPDPLLLAHRKHPGTQPPVGAYTARHDQRCGAGCINGPLALDHERIDHGFLEPTSWADEYRRILKLFETRVRNR